MTERASRPERWGSESNGATQGGEGSSASDGTEDAPMEYFQYIVIFHFWLWLITQAGGRKTMSRTLMFFWPVCQKAVVSALKIVVISLWEEESLLQKYQTLRTAEFLGYTPVSPLGYHKKDFSETNDTQKMPWYTEWDTKRHVIEHG